MTDNERGLQSDLGCRVKLPLAKGKAVATAVAGFWDESYRDLLSPETRQRLNEKEERERRVPMTREEYESELAKLIVAEMESNPSMSFMDAFDAVIADVEAKGFNSPSCSSTSPLVTAQSSPPRPEAQS